MTHISTKTVDTLWEIADLLNKISDALYDAGHRNESLEIGNCSMTIGNNAKSIEDKINTYANLVMK